MTRWLATSLGIAWLFVCSTLTCWGQEPVVGTAAAPMANQNATKVALHVSAEGDFTWILDKVTQGRISAAAGVKEVMIAPGPHEITAKNSDGQTIFIHDFTVSPDKQNAVRIVPRAPRAATTG